jgi:hypothetical protein
MSSSIGDRLMSIFNGLREFPMKLEMLTYGTSWISQVDADLREALDHHMHGYLEMNMPWIEEIQEEIGIEESDIAARIVRNRAMIALMKIVCTRISGETVYLENHIKSYRYRARIVRAKTSYGE